MLTDCCVLWCWELSLMAAIEQWRPPWSINAQSPIVKENLSPGPILLFCHRHRHRHASFPNYVAARMTHHNHQFGMEAAAPMAPMLTRMLIVNSLERYCQLPGTKPHVFLCRSQPTTNPQCPLMHHDLKCLQRPSWLHSRQTTVTQNIEV